MLLLIFLISALSSVKAALFYDTYKGTPLTLQEVELSKKLNTTFWCVAEIEPCNPNEGSRVDGSCNNIKYPSRGASHTPFGRLLPAVYAPGPDYNPRTALSGNLLPLCRKLSTKLLKMGTLPDLKFTLLLTYVLVFLAADSVSVQDTASLVLWKPYCCEPKGKTDYMCAPNPVPIDDPVHRFDGCRCMNQTKPQTYQSSGCVSNDTIRLPERISSATPLLDVSPVYGSSNERLNEKGRLYKGGFLKYEIDKDGNMWPPQLKLNESLCYLNVPPHETRCHDTPEAGTNSLMGINIISVYLWRYHNYIAARLGVLNPCWDDNKLFWTTREIVVASVMQIYFYELLPPWMGRENLLQFGLIGKDDGYREEYDDTLIPQQYLEYSYTQRWVHTLQESTLKLYDDDGCFMNTVPLTNLTLRSGYLDRHLKPLSKGAVKQACAAFGPDADPYMKELALGSFQRVFDVFTADCAKGRTLGFPPYYQYKDYCLKILPKGSYKNSIDPAAYEAIMDLYDNEKDIDLMTMLWMENKIPGGYVPPTFFCLVGSQLKYNIKCDKHWYERKNRVNAFTPSQLKAIRAITMSSILCAVSGLKSVQPQAFLRENSGNRECSCDQIIQLDLSPWKDDTCRPSCGSDGTGPTGPGAGTNGGQTGPGTGTNGGQTGNVCNCGQSGKGCGCTNGGVTSCGCNSGQTGGGGGPGSGGRPGSPTGPTYGSYPGSPLGY